MNPGICDLSSGNQIGIFDEEHQIYKYIFIFQKCGIIIKRQDNIKLYFLDKNTPTQTQHILYCLSYSKKWPPETL